MRIKDNNSTACVDVVTEQLFRFYSEAEEHEVDVDCPLCDGDNDVHYEDEEGETKYFQCPHCRGEQLTTTIYIEEIEDEELVTESRTVTPYEDNNLDYSRTSASDHISSPVERQLVQLASKFISSTELRDRMAIAKKKQEEQERLQAQREAIRGMINSQLASLDSAEDSDQLEEIISNLGKDLVSRRG